MGYGDEGVEGGEEGGAEGAAVGGVFDYCSGRGLVEGSCLGGLELEEGGRRERVAVPVNDGDPG